MDHRRRQMRTTRSSPHEASTPLSFGFHRTQLTSLARLPESASTSKGALPDSTRKWLSPPAVASSFAPARDQSTEYTALSCTPPTVAVHRHAPPAASRSHTRTVLSSEPDANLSHCQPLTPSPSLLCALTWIRSGQRLHPTRWTRVPAASRGSTSRRLPPPTA